VAKKPQTSEAQGEPKSLEVLDVVLQIGVLVSYGTGATCSTLVVEEQCVTGKQPIEIGGQVVLVVALKPMHNHQGVAANSRDPVEEGSVVRAGSETLRRDFGRRSGGAACQSEDA
jgi:hypothetical protein